MKRSKSDRISMYQRIKELLNQRLKISQISRILQISRKTVYEYMAKSEDEFFDYVKDGRGRPKKLEPYEDFIRRKLELCRDASSAQIFDWLKEEYKEISIGERTVFNYVQTLREKYNLPKKKEENQRDYEMVEELPEGKQMQVDFGEYWLRDQSERRVKVYFMGMVLSHSRYKYFYIQNSPFTTTTTVEAHEKGFSFFGGIPREIVYDQDRVLVKDENIGDVVFTKEFQRYKQERGFEVYLCRKKDPESKGKIEAFVKYVKQNFLKYRVFYEIELLNEQALEWLARTGNSKIHGTTKRIPAEEYEHEKPYLKPYSEPYKIEVEFRQYNVRKDNTVSYKGNFYTVPLGTFRNLGKVWVVEENGFLIIRDDIKEIARHRIQIGRGHLVRQGNHRIDREGTHVEMMQSAIKMFTDQEKALLYFEKLYEIKKRYFRDQLAYLFKVSSLYNAEDLTIALCYCLDNDIYSAGDFAHVLQYFRGKKNQDKNLEVTLLNTDRSLYNILPQRSNIELYQHLVSQE